MIATAWGLAVTAGIFASLAVGGVAHLNCAVTFALALAGATPWNQVPGLVAGQLAGAFVAAVLVWLVYLPHWAGTEDQGAKLAIFCTGPAIRNIPADAMIEVIATRFLIVIGFLKVGLVSGGGSGHEPMHGGFVGLGMLDAACPGHVFTSPTPDQMFEASRAVNSGAGILHIVKNYTGDVMNFDLAADMLREEKIEVASVPTDDDVAVQDSLYTAGRRGVGLTVLMEKLLGGAAEKGFDLAQLKN